MRASITRIVAAFAAMLIACSVLGATAAPASASTAGPGAQGYDPWASIMSTEVHGVDRTLNLTTQVTGPDGAVAPGVLTQAWVGHATTDGAGRGWRMVASGVTDAGGSVTFRLSANWAWAALVQVRVPAQDGVSGGEGNPMTVPGVQLAHCSAAIASRVWVSGGTPGVSWWRANLAPGAPACARPGLPVTARVALRQAVHRYHWSGRWHARVAVRRVTELVSGGRVLGHRLARNLTVTRAARTVR